MAKPISPITLLLFSLLSLMSLALAIDYPLYTKSRWIVNENGHRVKLACANWPSHLKPVVAEGLSSKPMDSISKKIRDMCFNCVRLTWPLELMVNDNLAFNVTVKQSIERYGLDRELKGIQILNPSIVNHTAKDWYTYMQKGAEAVRASNPNVLVILSGLDFDDDLTFLKDRPVKLSFKKKLVLELHWFKL